jgi:signal transduction histidine kinase
MENNVPLLTNDQAVHATTISQPWLHILRVAWVILAILAVIILIASIPGYIMLLEARTKLIEFSAVSPVWIEVLKIGTIVTTIAAVSLSLFLAWVIFRQKSQERMPVYLSYFLVLYGIAIVGQLETIYPFLSMLPNYKFGLIISSLFGPVFVALFALFPDGQFVPSWTRWLILPSLSIVPVSYFLEASSFAVIFEPIFWIGACIAIGCLALGMYSQIYRFLKVSDPSERQQTKWVIYGICMWFLVMAIGSVPYAQVQLLPPGSSIPWWHLLNQLVYIISFSFLPLSLTIAVMRYRLYDINLIINRTLVYGALTIATIGIYVFMVGYLGSLLQVIDQSAFAFLATGVVAVIFQPLHGRLQGTVNRLMYGERDDPLAVLNSLSKRLEAASDPEAILPSIVETVSHALKLPYVAIEVFNGKTTHTIAAYGEPRETSERLSLVYQAERVGHMIFAHRGLNEDFSQAESKLLRNIARQTGAAVHTAKLTSDLRRSRQQLITTREEERRRLRRDLHDGLGPTLASLSLKIDTARNLLTRNPTSADQLLVETKKQIQETLGDIRRLVYNLRPPTLDELGLVKAVQVYIDQQNIEGINIRVEDPGELPILPAAVEVAAYRITLEGIMNIIRHAQASKAVVRLIVDSNNLIAEVIDNGIGFPEPVPVGVGITSMRERAEELGGRLVLYPRNPGSRVQAILPITEE